MAATVRASGQGAVSCREVRHGVAATVQQGEAGSGDRKAGRFMDWQSRRGFRGVSGPCVAKSDTEWLVRPPWSEARLIVASHRWAA